jgi:hypothetical protein
LRQIVSTSWLDFSETRRYENKHIASSNHTMRYRIAVRMKWTRRLIGRRTDSAVVRINVITDSVFQSSNGGKQMQSPSGAADAESDTEKLAISSKNRIEVRDFRPRFSGNAGRKRKKRAAKPERTIEITGIPCATQQGVCVCSWPCTLQQALFSSMHQDSA